jgi:hypothetical protein
MGGTATEVVVPRHFGAAVVEVAVGGPTEQEDFDDGVHPTNEGSPRDGPARRRRRGCGFGS